MFVSPVIQLFLLHIVMSVEYKYDIKRAYWITGGTMLYLGFIVLGKGIGYIQVIIKQQRHSFCKCSATQPLSSKKFDDTVQLT